MNLQGLSSRVIRKAVLLGCILLLSIGIAFSCIVGFRAGWLWMLHARGGMTGHEYFGEMSPKEIEFLISHPELSDAFRTPGRTVVLLPAKETDHLAVAPLLSLGWTRYVLVVEPPGAWKPGAWYDILEERFGKNVTVRGVPSASELPELIERETLAIAQGIVSTEPCFDEGMLWRLYIGEDRQCILVIQNDNQWLEGPGGRVPWRIIDITQILADGTRTVKRTHLSVPPGFLSGTQRYHVLRCGRIEDTAIAVTCATDWEGPRRPASLLQIDIPPQVAQ